MFDNYIIWIFGLFTQKLISEKWNLTAKSNCLDGH